MDNTLILPSGGFRKLRSFQCAQDIYDGTAVFCERFVDRKSRTRDQMIQAARSGVQNIAEGSLASVTSKKTELKLTGVARASLGELLLDYEDYLRQNGLRQWPKDGPEAVKARGLWREGETGLGQGRRRGSDTSDRSDQSDKSRSIPYRWSMLTADVLANTLICLINQTSYLLWQQMKALERGFLTNGGFAERMYTLRKKAR